MSENPRAGAGWEVAPVVTTGRGSVRVRIRSFEAELSPQEAEAIGRALEGAAHRVRVAEELLAAGADQSIAPVGQGAGDIPRRYHDPRGGRSS